MDGFEITSIGSLEGPVEAVGRFGDNPVYFYEDEHGYTIIVAKPGTDMSAGENIPREFYLMSGNGSRAVLSSTNSLTKAKLERLFAQMYQEFIIPI